MRIIVRPAANLPVAVTQAARRRIDFAIGRFHARLRSVTVRLTDVNGPKGGIDKNCLVTVRFAARKHKPIVIEDTDADGSAAMDRAIDRAARAVARAVQALTDWRVVRGRF
jgi:putative sigma-54 modulation protein